MFISFIRSVTYKEARELYATETLTREGRLQLEEEYSLDALAGFERQVKLNDLLSGTIKGSGIVLFTTIFAVLSPAANRRRDNQNIVGQISNRGVLILSKILSTALIVLMAMALVYLTHI